MMTEQNSSETTSRRLVDAFAVFGPAYLRWVESRMRPSDLSFARMRALWVLHCSGPRMMSDLRRQLGVTPGNVTALTDALESEGLVRRLPHPTDRRATLVDLTPAGAAKCDDLYDAQLDAVGTLFDDLSLPDQLELLRLIEALVAGLERRQALDSRSALACAAGPGAERPSEGIPGCRP